MTQTCAIDAGYWSTKFKWKGGLFNFRSLVEKSDDSLNTVNTWNVRFGDKSYLIGDGANGWNIEMDKTNNELYKIAIYTGLGLIADDIQESFDIVVSYPLGLYNKQNKLKFEEFIKGGYVDFEINGKRKVIRIRKCTVFPQTVPVVYLGNYKKIVISVLDIGGLTIQGCTVDRLNLVKDSRFSESKGCIIMFNELRKLLNGKYSLNIQDWEMEYIIKDGIGSDDSLKIIDDFMLNWVFDIKQILKRNGWNLEMSKIIFTGGGSLILEKYLSKVFNGCLSNDPVNDNVLGLWEVGKIVYE